MSRSFIIPSAFKFLQRNVCVLENDITTLKQPNPLQPEPAQPPHELVHGLVALAAVRPRQYPVVLRRCNQVDEAALLGEHDLIADARVMLVAWPWPRLPWRCR